MWTGQHYIDPSSSIDFVVRTSVIEERDAKSILDVDTSDPEVGFEGVL